MKEVYVSEVCAILFVISLVVFIYLNVLNVYLFTCLYLNVYFVIRTIADKDSFFYAPFFGLVFQLERKKAVKVFGKSYCSLYPVLSYTVENDVIEPSTLFEPSKIQDSVVYRVHYY